MWNKINPHMSSSGRGVSDVFGVGLSGVGGRVWGRRSGVVDVFGVSLRGVNGRE